MKKMLIVGLILGATVYGVSVGLDNVKDDLYQQAAIRCAMNPEQANCDQFNPAAGVKP
ncbi:MAG: hypothetical protein AB7I68_04705 [Porticoccaceae bacterium]